MVQLSHPYMTTGKIVALIIWTFVGKGSIDMYKIICLVYGHTSMKYNLRKNSVATRSDWYLCLVAQKLWVRRDLRYFPDQPTSCGFIWPLLCPWKPQIRGLMPLVRIMMMLKRYQCLGLLLPLRWEKRKCSQWRKMVWGLRQVSGVSSSPIIFSLCPGNGEFELLNAQPL